MQRRVLGLVLMLAVGFPVAAAHKPYFDQWLGQMQGVDIVDAEQALR